MVVYGIVLSRYLGPTQFGSVGAALGVTTLAYVFVDFGLAPLMTRDVARDNDVADRYASNVVAVKLALIVLVNIGLAVFLSLSPYTGNVVIIVWLYSLNSALAALIGVGSAGLAGLEEMHFPAIIQLARDTLNVTLSLAAIALHAGIVALVWISVAATAVQLIAIAVVAARNGVHASARLLRFRLATSLLIESLPFAAFVFVATIYGQVAVVMVSLLMSMRETGLYTAAISVAGVVAILAGVFAQTVFPVFSRYHAGRPDMLRMSYEMMFKYMVVLGVGMSIAAALATKDALRLVLGEEYVPATATAVILILNQLFAASYVNGTLLNATGRQRFFTITYAVAVTMQVGVTWILIPRYGAEGAALGYLIPGFLGYVFYTAVCHSLLELQLPWLLHGKCLLAAAAMSFAVLLLARVGLGMILSAILVGPVVYVGVVVLLKTFSTEDRELALQIVSPLRERFRPFPDDD